MTLRTRCPICGRLIDRETYDDHAYGHELAGDGAHDHRPVQHRDGKPPWCKVCGLTEDGETPASRISSDSGSDRG